MGIIYRYKKCRPVWREEAGVWTTICLVAVSDNCQEAIIDWSENNMRVLWALTSNGVEIISRNDI